MLRHLLRSLVLLLSVTAQAENPALLMPRPGDYAHLFWAEGFPSHTPSAPWRRVIRTGSYAFALDTDTLRVPHFGALPPGAGYEAAGQASDTAWQSLPAAALDLTLTVTGTPYRATAGGTWTALTGPRLIDSGRWFQRADVTDLVFTATDGRRLNATTRFETVAWPDRLGLSLHAQPGRIALPEGEPCFGRVGGGHGFAGANALAFPHRPELDPATFTLEFWAFIPADAQVSRRTPPWIAGKNHHEHADGNFGVILLGDRLRATLNIGGGAAHAHTLDAPARVKPETWHHLALGYDGETFHFFLNGQPAGEKRVGLPCSPGQHPLVFARRPDNGGDGYYFRGVLDEIRLHDRALTADEVRRRFRHPEQPVGTPVQAWDFDPTGSASLERPGETWPSARLDIALRPQDAAAGAGYSNSVQVTEAWSAGQWRQVDLLLEPGTPTRPAPAPALQVQADETPSGKPRPVAYLPALGAHRVDLNGIESVLPAAGAGPDDAMFRVKLRLANPSDHEEVARLFFDWDHTGMRHRAGSPITGISAVLRDAQGRPTGIPVQLSKNWHNHPEKGVHAGTWFHGFTQVRLPGRAEAELELSLVHGHWGGLPTASHAQLSLVGWGSNQQWDQAALGAWGESICFEPDQAQAACSVTDVRPLMVRAMNGGEGWTWTHNVGGADWFRLFDPAGKRGFPAGMRTAYSRQGPCLTEVTYAGRLGDGLTQSATVSLAQADDLLRVRYHLRLDATKPVDYSRLVFFQVGADTYSYTGERRLALGNESGLVREWDTRWGGDTNRTEAMECVGRVPWISLHDAVRREEKGAWANRGIVIREWTARLGGKDARPWLVERGVRARGTPSSTADLVPPPGVTRLEPGDFVNAVIEHLVIPQRAEDYLGPNAALRSALREHGNTWRMVEREAKGNDVRVEVATGTLEGRFPALTLRAANGHADLTLTGGIGPLPVTFTGLPSHVPPPTLPPHGQTDFDPATGTWSHTVLVPAGEGARRVQF